MRVMLGPPDGIHVAITTPLFGLFVMVMAAGPTKGETGAVTHRVCPLEPPQVAACATPDPRGSIETSTAPMTSTRRSQRRVLVFRIAHLSPVDDQGARYDQR